MDDEVTVSPLGLIKVKRTTDVKKLGSCMALAVQDGFEQVSLRAIGAAAVNQAVKGFIIGTHYLRSESIYVQMAPSFEMVPGENGSQVTAVVMKVVRT